MSGTTRRIFVALLALLLTPLATLPAAERPNVLLIVCDDLNSYIEGFGGHPQAKTPNIARLRDSGVSFLQAHCTSPICAPSRSSFLTGLYPHTSRNYGFDKWFDNEVLKNSRTLMDHFRANGYHTLGTGKLMHQEVTKEWSEWGNDVDYGPFAFDGKENVAHPDVPAPLRNDFGAVDGSFGPLVKLEGRTFKDGKTYSWRTGNWKGMRPLRVESDDDRDPTADELNRDWAVAKLKGLANQPGGKPFFMGVGFIRPHTPIIVPKRFFDLFPLASVKLPVIKPGDVDDTFLRTVSGTDQGDLDRGAKVYQSLVASYGSQEEALRRFIQSYLASVAADDEHLGKILAVIDNSPLKDNTIIILTSDHGWQMGQKDFVYKTSLWEESTRVPLIIRVPGVTKGGATSHPVSLVDLYPTLVDLCGLTGDTRKNAQGRPLDGHSLKPFLLDPNTEKWDGPDAALTTLFRWAKTYNPSEQSYTLRSKDWRYIRYSNGKEELYDHVNDPHEWTNLAGNPEHAARLAIFRQQLTKRLPAPAANPVPQKTDVSRRSVAKTDAEAWKDKFFKQHPEADANHDGVLSWPEYKAYKAKCDAEKAKNKPQP
ncbi:MAG: sulfatase [Thermoguttaceae bacterium]